MDTATGDTIKGRTGAGAADERRRRAVGARGVVTIGVLLALASPAFAFDLCMTRTGHLRAAIPAFGGCRPGYHTVALVTADELPATPPTTIPPPATTGYGRVVGADGVQGGILLSAGYFEVALALREVSGQSVVLPLASDGLVARGFGYPYFSTPDCSGAPLVVDQSGSLVAFPPVVSGYAYIQNGAGTERVAGSFLVETSDCGEWGGTTQGAACCVPQGAGAVFAPATPMDAKALGLVPPLRIVIE